MRIVIVSDTHLMHAHLRLPPGDILIHCGDFYDAENQCTDKWLKRINLWFEKQSQFGRRIYVPGNHDFPLSSWGSSAERMLYSAECLIDRGLDIKGLLVWGAPWTPGLEGWAYGTPSGRAETWDNIPDQVDNLVTHAPPLGILDTTRQGDHLGCEFLRTKVFETRPKLHCFGHAHSAYGEIAVKGTRFVNAAQAIGIRFRSSPIVVDL